MAGGAVLLRQLKARQLACTWQRALGSDVSSHSHVSTQRQVSNPQRLFPPPCCFCHPSCVAAHCCGCAWKVLGSAAVISLCFVAALISSRVERAAHHYRYRQRCCLGRACLLRSRMSQTRVETGSNAKQCYKQKSASDDAVHHPHFQLISLLIVGSVPLVANFSFLSCWTDSFCSRLAAMSHRG